MGMNHLAINPLQLIYLRGTASRRVAKQVVDTVRGKEKIVEPLVMSSGGPKHILYLLPPSPGPQCYEHYYTTAILDNSPTPPMLSQFTHHNQHVLHS